MFKHWIKAELMRIDGEWEVQSVKYPFIMESWVYTEWYLPVGDKCENYPMRWNNTHLIIIPHNLVDLIDHNYIKCNKEQCNVCTSPV